MTLIKIKIIGTQDPIYSVHMRYKFLYEIAKVIFAKPCQNDHLDAYSDSIIFLYRDD